MGKRKDAIVAGTNATRRDAASDDGGQRQGAAARPGRSCTCIDLFCGTARSSLCRRLSISLRQPFCTLHEDEKNDILNELPIAIPPLQAVCVQLT